MTNPNDLEKGNGSTPPPAEENATKRTALEKETDPEPSRRTSFEKETHIKKEATQQQSKSSPDSTPPATPRTEKVLEDGGSDTKHGKKDKSSNEKSPATTAKTTDAARRKSSSSEPIPEFATPVPRDQRRGLFARLTVLPEVDEPKAYPRRTKWIITFIVAIAGAAAPTGSGVVFPALNDITRTFHADQTITNLSVALYMLSMSIFPLWWSNFSETFGRRSIYLVSFTLFIIFGIISALSQSIAMLVVFRMLNGGASASVQAVGAGTIADIWEVRERGRAMGIFYLGPLCGPLLSPIIGGALTDGFGWRATQWFLVVYGGVQLIAMLFFLPETLKNPRPVVAEAAAEVEQEDNQLDRVASENSLRRSQTLQSIHAKTRTSLKALRHWLLDPLKILLYLRFPVVAITVFYAAITFGTLYLLNISIEITFSAPPYNFSSIIIGCLYIPNSLGYFLASILGGRWVDYIMHREARRAGRYDEKGNLIFRPEDRMGENAWLAALVFPCVLVWYGWTAEKGVFWLVPMIANFFFGCSTMLIFGMATTMLTEFMPRKASHGIAVNNFVRNILSCVAGIVAAPLINAIGNGPTFSGLAVIVLAGGIFTLTSMRKWGSKWGADMAEKLGD